MVWRYLNVLQGDVIDAPLNKAVLGFFALKAVHVARPVLQDRSDGFGTDAFLLVPCTQHAVHPEHDLGRSCTDRDDVNVACSQPDRFDKHPLHQIHEQALVDLGVLDRVNANGDSTDVFGNLFMDPELAMEGDFPDFYFPTEDSPCIDAGDPEGDPDPDSTRADIGAFFFPQCNIRVEPDVIEFVDVQTSTTAEVELEIRNVGLDTLEIIDMYITPERGRIGFDFEWEDLLAGFSATGYVLFFPDREGRYEAVLHIESNDRDAGLLEIPISGTALEVETPPGTLPTEFAIVGVYPNPFNDIAKVKFLLPEKGNLQIDVYSIYGRRLAHTEKRDLPPGSHAWNWDASGFSIGVYILTIHYETSGRIESESIKIIHLQ